jgi:hypothetical protein
VPGLYQHLSRVRRVDEQEAQIPDGLARTWWIGQDYEPAVEELNAKGAAGLAAPLSLVLATETTDGVAALEDSGVAEFLDGSFYAADALVGVDDAEAFGGEEAEHWITEDEVVVGIGWVDAELRRDGLEQDVVDVDGRAGVGEVSVGEVVQRVLGEHVGLAIFVEVDVVAELA